MNGCRPGFYPQAAFDIMKKTPPVFAMKIDPDCSGFFL
jgi:hypothetical protein